jgi:hypothetical protein
MPRLWLALTASAVDVLEGDGYLLGTPVQSRLGALRPKLP